jgi:hypothetical protein
VRTLDNKGMYEEKNGTGSLDYFAMFRGWMMAQE